MKNNLILIFITLLLYNCANQTSPTGGPKDEAPPVLISSNPADQEINFQGQEIILTFDEYIKLNNPRQQVIITPRLDQEVIYTHRRNRVILEFDQPLEENTTYSINFRDAIQDITEGNPANLRMAFSTGNYIDSLQLSGNIYKLMKNEPAQNMIVALQVPMDTSEYFLHPPLYFTNSLEDGTFLFTNLQNTTYRLYAFNDVNNDLILQPSREMHGFHPEPIQLRKDSTGFDIPMVNVNTDSLKIISARQSGRYFDVNFNKPVVQYDIAFEEKSLPYMLNPDLKTIRFFNILQLNDSIPVYINARDSIGTQVQQPQIFIKSQETVRQPEEFTFTIPQIKISKINPELDFRITFNKPLQNITYDSLTIFIDSLNTLPVKSEDIKLNKSRTELHLTKTLTDSLLNPREPASPERKINPHLMIGVGAFISVENDSSRSSSNKITVFEETAVGILHVEVDVPYENFIVELLNAQYQVVERRYNERNVKFINLSPAKYVLRVLEDSGNDHFWDVGNIFWNVPPDKVNYYINPEEGIQFTIRSNWELGPHIISDN